MAPEKSPFMMFQIKGVKTVKDKLSADEIELFKDISAKNALINKELNKIAELAGIDKRISMHISRHSFAKIAKDEGTDNSAIQQMLAHSSLKIMEGYMG